MSRGCRAVLWLSRGHWWGVRQAGEGPCGSCQAGGWTSAMLWGSVLGGPAMSERQAGGKSSGRH